MPAHAMPIPAPVIPFLSSLPFLFLPRFSRLLSLLSCPTLSSDSLEPADVDHAGARVCERNVVLHMPESGVDSERSAPLTLPACP
ncbi:hypothetical protein B0H14DRAFT_3495581 [Mycena olivaceomarginata]|nr:hypothetical protein B0H14DRAFT_3495581 [Mycena olivaceomarginata]